MTFQSFLGLTDIVKKTKKSIILATGDTSQLEPISSLSNQLAYDVYSDFCFNQLFSKEMFLTENKRLKSDEDKLILKQIKADVFNQDSRN